MTIPRMLALCLAAGALSAQSPPAGGMPPVWDIRAVFEQLAAHAGRMLPVLEKVNASRWTEQGASDTYAAQLASCKEQARALEQGAKDLARQPERLSAALELYFRMHSLDAMLASLQEGIRKYQDQATADLVSRTAAENGRNREQLQRFIAELAAQREQQLALMDQEAQRCRGVLVRQPAPSNSMRKK